jgi:hypothetical protein
VFEKGLQESGRNEYCVTEPDARLQRCGRSGMLFGYNVQSAIDGQTGPIVHPEVTQAQTDTDQLLATAEQTSSPRC